MNYIVFNNQEQANALNQRITVACLPVWNDGLTSNYCEVLKHPEQELYAIVVDPNYEQYFTAQELQNAIELTSDWKPTLNIPQ